MKKTNRKKLIADNRKTSKTMKTQKPKPKKDRPKLKHPLVPSMKKREGKKRGPFPSSRTISSTTPATGAKSPKGKNTSRVVQPEGKKRSDPQKRSKNGSSFTSKQNTISKEGKKRPSFTSRRAGAAARRASGKSPYRSARTVSPSKTKKSVPKTKAPRKPRTVKEVKTYAVWVVFDNFGKRVETFPYHDRPAAERCLAKKQGRRLKDGKYENGTFYLNLVKES